MPDYFFHVSLELFLDAHSLSPDQTTPPELSHAFKALKPFLRPQRLLNTRETKHNLPRRSPVSKFHAPSTSIFERAIAEQIQASPSTDHRLDRITLEYADMDQPSNETEPATGGPGESHIEKGLGTLISGVQTKGRYTPLIKNATDEEWGIVHLYRDASETPGLYKESPSPLLRSDIYDAGNGATVPKSKPMTPLPPARDEDCTTLCILAVPSYLTSADFLAFVGEKTRDQVSHFRMIRTSRQNRYMVLMKFRNGKRAREWQADWNGRVFNSMEPETVHVVFLKSVEIMTGLADPKNTASGVKSIDTNGTSTFPETLNDPFAKSSVTPSARPPAPRTSSLVELPTCPVCLERMDETTGLLTILCQHIFHCTCLQKWSGGGCPVCRYTHDDFSTRVSGSSNNKQKTKSKTKTNGHSSEYEISDEPLECEVCHTDAKLWQCLICGAVGCGRYEGKHAFEHFKETGHTFAMDLDEKRVWDYAEDVYVHRIIEDAAKPGEKLVELPGRSGEATALENRNEDAEVAKMEGIAIEYTHLLTSQLESQRIYFEEIVERAADKASEASKQSQQAIRECEEMRAQLDNLSHERHELLDQKLPSLESERARLEKRASKFEDTAKSITAKYLEERSLTSSLMERIKFLEDTQIKTLDAKIQSLQEDLATKELLMEGLVEEHRDAMMQISAQQKLREMVANGELDAEDLVGATIEAGPAAVVKKGKKPVNRATANANSSSQALKPETRDELAQELAARLGSDKGRTRKGRSSDEDKVNKLVEEFNAKMLEQGLLEETEDGTDSHIEETKGPSSSKKKKKKGKGKR